MGHAQFNQDAPWMKDLNQQARKNANNPITFQETVNAFNMYWETRNPNVKGSGYKPFKRWEAFWENHIKADGTIPTGKEIWNTHLALQSKKGQQKDLANQSNWQAIGPFSHSETGSWSPGQGRVNVIVKDPNNSGTYYVGAPAGGFWKSTNGGSTWITTTDELPQIGVSGIAVDPNNSDIIYIATGDDDAGDSDSVGVMKSTDGGMTWNNTGLNPGNSPDSMNDIYVSNSNSQVITVATNNGVYKSANGGNNWSVASGTSGKNMRDLKIKPNTPSVAYSVSASRFYRSTDGGDNFSQVTSGLPTTGISRLVIDVTPDNPNVVYILASDSNNNFKGIYKSANSGQSFTQVASPGANGDIFESTQSWYDLAFSVSDTDENKLFVGVLNIWRGTVSGSSSSFTKINNWSSPNQASYTHADIHYMRYFNGELLVGSDGGFYKSTNDGSSFTDLTEGMQISQFYRIAVSKQTSDKMAGGLQDNGGFALNNGQWQNYYGADGMDSAVDPQNSNIYYGFIQSGGSLYISNNAGASLSTDISGPESGNWITPLVMNSDREIYAGYTKLYKLNGNSFSAVSSTFSSKIDVLEIDDLEPDNIYVAVNGALHKSTNRGSSFSEVENFPKNITSIEVNNSNSNIVYVTTSTIVYKSTNGGNSFTNITTGILSGTGINVIKHQDLHSENPLFVGTNFGVFRYDDQTLTWDAFENGLPNSPVRDLDINTTDFKITAATYGRGIWQSPVPEELIANDVKLVSLSGFDATIISCDSQITPGIEVKNNGANVINAVDIIYTIDGIDTPYNWTGTIASEDTKIITLPVVSFNRGLHTFSATATIAADGNSGNNTSNEQLVKSNDFGTVDVINTFQNTSDGLLVYDEGADTRYWTRGIPTGTLLNDSANPTNKVYGTNLSGDHITNVKSYLVSQCYDLTTLQDPTLKFDMAFELEQDWDIVYVEYSLNEGLSWDVLGTANDPNWYNSDRQSSSADCTNCPGAQWTGTDATLRGYSHDLFAFAGETKFMYRFVFHSDPGVVEEGAIIDNPIITGSTLSVDEFEANGFVVYPNPSKGVFTIKASTLNSFKYDVHDITGKKVVEQTQANLSNSLYKLDISNYASGVYFLNVTTANSRITKKLILN